MPHLLQCRFHLVHLLVTQAMVKARTVLAIHTAPEVVVILIVLLDGQVVIAHITITGQVLTIIVVHINLQVLLMTCVTIFTTLMEHWFSHIDMISILVTHMGLQEVMKVALGIHPHLETVAILAI